ncbi:MAG: pyridoxamine 5'-phosphate oxidase family protein [Bacteroidales bacterium]|nr:pyridoxamine 5'-phosphate oxidase family protein [Bacteroidales bacterium]
MRRKDREITETESIEKIIRKADVCRIAMANGDIPYIVTLNFGYSGGTHPCLYFHCAPDGRKLDMIQKNNRVCFEMDTDHVLINGKKGCDWGMNYSSVVGYGRISVIRETGSKILALNCIMSQYSELTHPVYDQKMVERTTLLRLDIEEMTGKRK